MVGTRRTKRRFQSTLPARGATDNQRRAARWREYISIHAPCTGSDHFVPLWFLTYVTDFNPRSLHGERQTIYCSTLSLSEFQSTLPARGATATARILTRCSKFQSTLPARGATGGWIEAERNLSQFQSTLPARGATIWCESRDGEVFISIHAPCTGSDRAEGGGKATPDISIHAPCTGSDTVQRAAGGDRRISIHAPCTGSDSMPPLLFAQAG